MELPCFCFSVTRRAEEDLPEYTKRMGIGQIVIGIAFCLAA